MLPSVCEVGSVMRQSRTRLNGSAEKLEYRRQLRGTRHEVKDAAGQVWQPPRRKVSRPWHRRLRSAKIEVLLEGEGMLVAASLHVRCADDGLGQQLACRTILRHILPNLLEVPCAAACAGVAGHAAVESGLPPLAVVAHKESLHGLDRLPSVVSTLFVPPVCDDLASLAVPGLHLQDFGFLQLCRYLVLLLEEIQPLRNLLILLHPRLFLVH
mmetsp:Transcript_27458/g.77666  ORF Transcript_27458/g.77666 Transcript_27458/m.77666 type:complete len:212 (+) Transcript_27458:139-774(+)